MVIQVIHTEPQSIARLIRDLPEFEIKNTSEEIVERVKDRDGQFIACKSGDQFAGFLVSYALSQNTYYNWIMGILPPFRRKSHASLLMDEFEEYAKRRGYKRCRVKTMNRFHAMLNLLIRRSYNIISVEEDGKLVFEKEF